MKIAFTICTNSFLSLARAAAKSFLKHHHDYEFFVGIIDPRDPDIEKYYEGFKIVYCDKIGVDGLESMAKSYNISELSCALKSYFTRFFIKEYPSASEILYLDADLFFYAPLAELAGLHTEYDIVLTPHIINPMVFDGKQPDEIAYLATGTYNGGFFSMRVTENSRRFINWWCERMRDYCFYSLEQGLFVDQKWMNLVPVFFDKVFIIKAPGYNVSYWNLHERSISLENDQYWVNKEDKLRFFHYSSINLKQGILFYKQQDRFTETSLPLVKDLFMKYRELVFHEGYEQTSKSPSFYGRLFKDNEAALLRKTLKGRVKLWIKNNVSEKRKAKLKQSLKGLFGS
jgi:lipopolysaccharide biosynthesis glycosyltransferase